MAQLDLPDSMDSISSDAIIYRDQNVEVIIEPFEGDLAVNMYVENHDDFEDITPGEVAHCDKYSSPPDSASSVVDLPDTYTSLFKAAVSACREQYGVQRKDSSKPLGVCASCYPNDGEGGTLSFSEYMG